MLICEILTCYYESDILQSVYFDFVNYIFLSILNNSVMLEVLNIHVLELLIIAFRLIIPCEF